MRKEGRRLQQTFCHLSTYTASLRSMIFRPFLLYVYIYIYIYILIYAFPKLESYCVFFCNWLYSHSSILWVLFPSVDKLIIQGFYFELMEEFWRSVTPEIVEKKKIVCTIDGQGSHNFNIFFWGICSL